MSGRYIHCRIPVVALVALLTTTAFAQENDIVTSVGRWRKEKPQPQLTASQRQLMASDARSELATTEALTGATLAVSRVAPLVTDRNDLALLLTGRTAGANLQEHMQQRMQIIPEIPHRYDDPKFDPVRLALNPCINSAAAYRDKVLAIANANDIEDEANSFVAGEAATNYEHDCMTPLANVPLAVRQITGVLVYHNVPWCSATIVGPDRLLTARHCFVDPESGKQTEAYDPVSQHLVGFTAVEQHGGQHNFTVTWAGGSPPPLAAFTPLEDMLLLHIADGHFDHFARTAAQSVQSQPMPLPVWVVGSN